MDGRKCRRLVRFELLVLLNVIRIRVDIRLGALDRHKFVCLGVLALTHGDLVDLCRPKAAARGNDGRQTE